MFRTPPKCCLTALITVVALVLLATSWASGSSPSEAAAGTLYNCPQAGKRAISGWSGEGGAPAQAPATGGGGGHGRSPGYVRGRRHRCCVLHSPAHPVLAGLLQGPAGHQRSDHSR